MSGARTPGQVETVRLAEGLRELRTRTGLSLAALAARTPYSKSSWERYLNGKKLPPRDAVAALCRLAQQPPGRLLALWELADHAWSGRAGAAGSVAAAVPAEAAPETARAAPADGPQPKPKPVRHGRRAAATAGVAAGAAAAAFTAVLLAVPGEGAGERRPAAGAVPASASSSAGCRGAACAGEDPESMRCGGAGRLVTPLERTVPGGVRLQIRYSTVCRAAWGRITHGRVGDRVVLTVPGERPRTVRVADAYDAGGYLVTPMSAASAGGGITLCLDPADGARQRCFRSPGGHEPPGP
ncbi:helix-turn-helix domain-containing protein [Streptomyces sclerotialus]|uniref:helix-turn-helix domain-containing protein n=1 Tax=Streptomyces sclerotialus TaxID=1957 RepID=UPI00068F2C64